MARRSTASLTATSSLLSGLLGRIGVGVPPVRSASVVIPEKKVKPLLVAVARRDTGVDAARLARHARMAGKVPVPAASRPSKPLKPATQPAEVPALAARIWAEVTNGAGVVLVDGQPLDIPVFSKGGVKP